MEKLKKQIRQKLIANVLVDKCAHSEYLIFRDAWCTQERVIRFTTRFFRELFPSDDESGGKWKTGDAVMYEANNEADSFTVNCVLNIGSVPYLAIDKRNALIKAVGANNSKGTSDIVLASWDLTRKDGDTNRLFESFDDLIEKKIPRFEQDLREKLDAEERRDEFSEGEKTNLNLSKYERNPKARAACIAAHGTSCAVCGIDFGKAYGPEFAGKIEVHHIVPLSEIGEEYVVDPINDLIPVCPNCHTALHSKPNGIYTVEELKEIRAKNGPANTN